MFYLGHTLPVVRDPQELADFLSSGPNTVAVTRDIAVRGIPNIRIIQEFPIRKRNKVFVQRGPDGLATQPAPNGPMTQPAERGSD